MTFKQTPNYIEYKNIVFIGIDIRSSKRIYHNELANKLYYELLI